MRPCSQTDIAPLLQIILDTDIGTDIDDVLALLTALHMPSEHVELLGITTNYHPTRLRQGVAKAVVAAAAAAGAEAQPPEREDAEGERLRRAKVLGTVAARMAQIPIIAGSSQLCGTHRTLFHHGNEGEGLSWSPEEKLAAWESAEGLEAAEYIYETCSKAPGEVSSSNVVAPTREGLEALATLAAASSSPAASRGAAARTTDDARQLPSPQPWTALPASPRTPRTGEAPTKLQQDAIPPLRPATSPLLPSATLTHFPNTPIGLRHMLLVAIRRRREALDEA